MAHDLKKAFEKGLATPAQKKDQDEKIRKEIIERAKKEFLKRKKKLYANEHPKYRSNNKQN